MKAVVFYGKGDLRVEEREIPQLKQDETLVRVHACGICGTDAHIFCGDEGAAETPAGTVLGHEFAGEVVAVGDAVTGFSVGDRVCIDPNKLCNECYYCKSGIGHFCENMIGIGTTVDGGFAEYCVVPASQVYRFPQELSYEAAAMTEPVSCCLHGIDLCNIRPGSTVAVIGCGMIGLLMIQLARLCGAATIIAIEPIEQKREMALGLGADYAFNPMEDDFMEQLSKVANRIETVIECVGRTNTVEMAIEIAGNASTVMLFGLTAPGDEVAVKPFTLFKKEITLKASYINPYTFTRALNLISSGKIDVSSMIYAKCPLEELPEILANPRKRSAGKYVITL